MNLRNRLLVPIFCLVTLLGLSAAPQKASAQGNWEYVPELQGWLDWDSGLVWTDGWDVTDRYGYGSWDWASTTFLTSHRANTGISAWRLATVAELRTIAANDGWPILYPPAPGDEYVYGTPVWSSESHKNKKDAYVVGHSGSYWYQPKRYYYKMLAVYRLFTP
jgi:hypothetical protein